MTEIQLKNIVDRIQSEKKDTKTDEDETMVQNGVVISKFSFEALGLEIMLAKPLKTKSTNVLSNGLAMTLYSPLKTAHQRYSPNSWISLIHMNSFQNMRGAKRNYLVSRPRTGRVKLTPLM